MLYNFILYIYTSYNPLEDTTITVIFILNQVPISHAIGNQKITETFKTTSYIRDIRYLGWRKYCLIYSAGYVYKYVADYKLGTFR